MFISFDNGAHWQPFQLNLPNVPVTDIKVHHKDLVVVDAGPRVLDSRRHQPAAPADRTEQRVRRRTCTSRATAIARASARRCSVPRFDYYLPSAPAGPVTVDILDDEGDRRQLVQQRHARCRRRARGRGGGRRSEDEPGDQESGGGRGRSTPPPRVTKNAGLNRFVWDVRHKNGLTVPPGRYQARLTVGGATATESFNVLIDPRVAADGVTLADLQEQFDHNVRMRDLIDDVNQLVARLRERAGEGSGRAAGRGRREAPDRAGEVRQARTAGPDHVSGRDDHGRGSENRPRRDRAVPGVEERARRRARRARSNHQRPAVAPFAPIADRLGTDRNRPPATPAS